MFRAHPEEVERYGSKRSVYQSAMMTRGSTAKQRSPL